MTTHSASQARRLNWDRVCRLPVGERLYAIGDVHGRLDLLKDLLEAVAADNAARSSVAVRILLLGDMIDRGHDGAAVIRECMRLTRLSDDFVVLKGNHEVMMTEAYQGSRTAMAVWLRVGGDATLYSFGVSADLIDEGDFTKLSAAMRERVPKDVIRWLNRLPVTYQAGDYFFVHAGVRPGVALARQRNEDMLWIKEEFTEDISLHPMMIVHGHSECDGGPEMRANRIGLDTAAYRTDILTALGLEGQHRWTINTCGRPKSRDAHNPDAASPNRNGSCAPLEIVRDIVPLSVRPKTPSNFGTPLVTRVAGVAASVLAIVIVITWRVIGSAPPSPQHSIERPPTTQAYIVVPHSMADLKSTNSMAAAAPIGLAAAGTGGLDRHAALSKIVGSAATPERILDSRSSKSQRPNPISVEAASVETAAIEASSPADGDDPALRGPMTHADAVVAGGTTTVEAARLLGATNEAATSGLIRMASPTDDLRRREALDLIRSLRRQ